MKKHPFLWGLFLLSFLSLFFYFLSGMFLKYTGKDGVSEKIAVVEVKGVIAESDDIVQKLKKYGNDSLVKGILVRINSPGGGVAASQEIYSEILRVRKKHGKKVLASMSSLGASGGYYIACAADKIVANPGTITGSIGVMMPFTNMEGLLGKIGVKTEIIKSGKFKDIGSPAREMTSAERGVLQASVDDVYSQFVEVIAKGRNLAEERVRELADGRIYTGRQAHEAGLIDKLGGYEDAMDLLVEMAGIQGEPKIIREKEDKGLLYRLLKGETKTFLNGGLFDYFSGFQYLWKL